MTPDLVEKDAFCVAGRSMVETSCAAASQRIPLFWEEWMQQGRCSQINGVDDFDAAIYGLCLGWSDETGYRYMIARPVDPGVTQKDDMETICIAKGLYAVFVAKGPVPEAIQDMWRHVMEEWLPESGFRMDMTRPSFERYEEGRFHAEVPETDVWLAVCR